MQRNMIVLLLLLFSPVLMGQDGIDMEIRAQDIIELNNGNRFEGRILSELNDLIQFETAAGKVSIARGDIRQILYRNPPEKIYEAKLRGDFNSLSHDSHLQVGTWCFQPEVRLLEQGTMHLEKAVSIDPARIGPYPQLIERYAARDLSDVEASDLEQMQIMECQILLAGINAGVPIDNLDELAVAALIRTGDVEAAVLLLQKMSSGSIEEPSVATSLRKLVVLLDSLGRSEESREAATRLREEGGGSDVQVLRRELRWSVLDYSAGALEKRGEIDRMVEELIEQGGDSGEVYLYRGSVRLIDGDLTAAESDFKKAFRAGSVDSVAATTFALSFARQGYFEKALDLLGSAASSEQVAVDWRLVEAYVLESQGDVGAAVELYEEAAEHEDSTWQARLLSIEAKRRFQNNWDPVQDLQKVMRSELLSPAAFAECAMVLGDHALESGRLPEARRWLEYAISSGSDGPDVMLRLALAQRGPGGDPARAREALDVVTEQLPRDADGWNALAELLHTQGDLEGARSALEKTISLYPEKIAESWSPETPVPLRWALRSQRRISRAIEQEYWFDDFERDDDDTLQNNWLEEEAYGVSVSIKDGTAFLQGVQKHQPDRLTTMKREILTPRLTGIRTAIRLLAAGPGTRIAFRIEDQSGGGIVFFRDPDGVLGFAVLGGKKVDMIRTDDEEAQEDYGLISTSWSKDSGSHQLEIAFSSDGKNDAELWFDGIRIAKGISYRPSRKSGLTGGFSGQAPLDELYGFSIDEFEVFRRKALVVREREY